MIITRSKNMHPTNLKKYRYGKNITSKHRVRILVTVYIFKEN